MPAQPTGIRAADGALELHRDFDIPAPELWEYLSDPAKTARWFGPWRGDPRSGHVEVILLAEQDAPSERVQVVKCDHAAHHLTVRTGEGPESWLLELEVSDAGSGSHLLFRMPGVQPGMAGSVGPGWEYYLDRLVVAAGGADPASLRFDPDYYPALRPYYEGLFGS